MGRFMKPWQRFVLEALLLIAVYAIVIGIIYVGGFWLFTGMLPW
jgi:hypothetical protein